VLVGKLNEPKLKNLAVVDLYVFVGCRETSLIDSK
jgi:diphthamide biosynthesis enzyme Dph1/Dph2-like protein